VASKSSRLAEESLKDGLRAALSPCPVRQPRNLLGGGAATGSGGAEAIASRSKAGTVRPALPTLLTATRAHSFGDPPAFATPPSKGRGFRITLEIHYDRIYEPYAR
jgi:hypothetical protein